MGESGGLKVPGGSSGVKVANGNYFGKGIYVSPCVSFSENYAPPFEGEYNIIFLVRVRPNSFTLHYRGHCSKEAMSVDREWVVNNESNVRLVAVLFKRK